MKSKITAPNKSFTGEIAGVPFLKGEATTDNQLVIDYCRNKGYEVEEETADEITDDAPGVPADEVPEEIDDASEKTTKKKAGK